MKPRTIILVLFGTLCATAPALALDYPAILRGSYAYPGEACRNPGLVIERSSRFNEVDVGCSVKALTALAPNRFSIVEQCNREGREWSQTTVFGLEQSGLRVIEGKDQALYMRCSAPAAHPPVAATAPIAAPSIKNCKVLPGQAGVTTFLDATLSRKGSLVRDFDDYTFRSTGMVKINKLDTLVGQLVDSDGKVSEPRSWAWAEEWECK